MRNSRRSVAAWPGSAHRAGQHDLLVAAALGVHHRVTVELLAGGHLEVVGGHPRVPEKQADHDGGRAQRGPRPPAEFGAEHGEDERHTGDRVHRAHHERALELAEDRDQQEREGEPAEQRAHVVGGEQVGHRAARGLLPDALQHHHEQRDLRADQQAEHERGADERRAVQVEPGERGVEAEHGQAAEQRQRQLDHRERDHRPGLQRLRHQRADAHREDHHAEHDRRLADRVADQVAAERDQRQLVHQAAGRADEDREQDRRAGQAPPRPCGHVGGHCPAPGTSGGSRPGALRGHPSPVAAALPHAHGDEQRGEQEQPDRGEDVDPPVPPEVVAGVRQRRGGGGRRGGGRRGRSGEPSLGGEQRQDRGGPGDGPARVVEERVRVQPEAAQPGFDRGSGRRTRCRPSP